MNCWLCILNKENFEIVLKKEIWGVSQRYKKTLSKTEVGDKLVFYITGESVFIGISEVISSIFIDDESIFFPISRDKNQKFPFRIRIKPVRTFKQMIRIKSLIPTLNFIKHKKRYQVHFMGKAMLHIGNEDLNTIINADK